MMIRGSFRHMSLMGLSLLALSSCTAIVAGTAATVAYQRINADGKMSLAATTYAATDMLSSNARHNVSSSMPIVVLPLNNLRAPDGPPPAIGEPPDPNRLGRVMADQIESRLVQTGYTVLDADGGMLMQPKVKVTGAYLMNAGEVMVNLRMVDTQGRILGTYDYKMPETTEIRQVAGKVTMLDEMTSAIRN